MEFKIKYSYIFFRSAFFIVVPLWLAWSSFNRPFSNSWIGRHAYEVWLFTAFNWLVVSSRSIWAALTDKTILVVNEEFIYDYINDIHYYWKDIEEVKTRHSNLFAGLYLRLYNPANYLDKIGNFRFRYAKKLWFKPNGKHSEYAIELALVNVETNELLEILNKYSTLSKQS